MIQIGIRIILGLMVLVGIVWACGTDNYIDQSFFKQMKRGIKLIGLSFLAVITIVGFLTFWVCLLSYILTGNFILIS